MGSTPIGLLARQQASVLTEANAIGCPSQYPGDSGSHWVHMAPLVLGHRIAVGVTCRLTVQNRSTVGNTTTKNNRGVDCSVVILSTTALLMRLLANS